MMFFDLRPSPYDERTLALAKRYLQSHSTDEVKALAIAAAQLDAAHSRYLEGAVSETTVMRKLRACLELLVNFRESTFRALATEIRQGGFVLEWKAPGAADGGAAHEQWRWAERLLYLFPCEVEAEARRLVPQDPDVSGEGHLRIVADNPEKSEEWGSESITLRAPTATKGKVEEDIEQDLGLWGWEVEPPADETIVERPGSKIVPVEPDLSAQKDYGWGPPEPEVPAPEPSLKATADLMSAWGATPPPTPSLESAVVEQEKELYVGPEESPVEGEPSFEGVDDPLSEFLAPPPLEHLTEIAESWEGASAETPSKETESIEIEGFDNPSLDADLPEGELSMSAPLLEVEVPVLPAFVETSLPQALSPETLDPVESGDLPVLEIDLPLTAPSAELEPEPEPEAEPEPEDPPFESQELPEHHESLPLSAWGPRVEESRAPGAETEAVEEARPLLGEPIGRPLKEPAAVEFHAAIPVFRIFDKAMALEFYCDFLGFSLEWEHRLNETAPTYMAVYREGLSIHLTEHHNDCCPGSSVFVWMSAVEEFYRELAAKGYRHFTSTMEMSHHATYFEMTDPFGNRLRFSQPLELDADDT